jgi:NAD(P)-dependent dehydrogenase (short-subunit alcohol dehydrogenase family)
MNTKTVLITGVTGSIGGATAYQIAKSGATTILLGRNKQKLEVLKEDIILKSNNNAIEIVVADLSDISSVKKAVAEIKQSRKSLDVLVNVAAVYRAKRELSKNGLEMMFATNHLGVFTLTTGLLDLIKAENGGRIVTVAAPSTTVLNFDDLQGEKKYSAFNAFGASKMANLLFTHALAKKLEGTNVTTNSLHPGLVKSDITNEMPGPLKFFLKLISTTPDKPAHTLKELALSEKFKNVNGKFFDAKEKELKAAKYAYDENAQNKLWKLSEELLNSN